MFPGLGSLSSSLLRPTWGGAAVPSTPAGHVPVIKHESAGVDICLVSNRGLSWVAKLSTEPRVQG